MKTLREKRQNENKKVQAGEQHFQEGHLNTHVLDHESSITGYGVHDRVIAFCSEVGGKAYARIDTKWNLGEPTDKEIIKVGREQGWRGKWKVVSREVWNEGKCIDVHLEKQ